MSDGFWKLFGFGGGKAKGAAAAIDKKEAEAKEKEKKEKEKRETPRKSVIMRKEEAKISAAFGYLTKEQRDKYRKIFDSYDADGGGSISKEELKLALEASGRKIDDVELRTMMAHVDVDGDGNIDFSEFLTLVAPPPRQSKQLQLASTPPAGSAAIDASLSQTAGATSSSPLVSFSGGTDNLFTTSNFLTKLSKFSHLTKEQVQKYQEIFDSYDVDQGGSISGEELKEALTRCGRQLTDEELNEMIQQADTDGSGEIEFEEFLEMVAPNTHHQAASASPRGTQDIRARQMWQSLDPVASLTPEERDAYKAVFDEYDGDGGGSIDLNELKDALWALGGNPSLNEVAAVMREIDQDGNGKLEFKEFLQIVRPRVADDLQELEQVFDEWDKDKDGFLSPKELRAFLSAGIDEKDKDKDEKDKSKESKESTKAADKPKDAESKDKKGTPSKKRGSIFVPDKTPRKSLIGSGIGLGLGDTDSNALLEEMLEQCGDPRGLSFRMFAEWLTT